MHLGHIALSVSNLKRSEAFYGKFFGVRCVARYPRQDKGLTIVVLRKESLTLELFEFKKRKALPQYRKALDSDLRTLGVKHFSVEVDNVTSWFKKFKKAKCAFATDLRTFDNGKRYFFVKDPDGIMIEFMEAL